MNDFIAQQGWQCPLCKRVYSPDTPCCWYCGGESTTTTSFVSSPIETIKLGEPLSNSDEITKAIERGRNKGAEE